MVPRIDPSASPVINSRRRARKPDGTANPSSCSYQLFQMAVTEVSRSGVPSIRIAKWSGIGLTHLLFWLLCLQLHNALY